MLQLLPFEACHLETIQWGNRRVELVIHMTTLQSPCPRCAVVSSHRHSHYLRTALDLPWADYTVNLQLRVRRFRCRNTACSQQIFAERLGSELLRSARRTSRLTQWIQTLAMQATAQSMGRVLPSMAVPVSPRTLLRLMHAVPDPHLPPPTVIGIDDWAWKKGRNYGTICVDLERRRPIDLLPDREPATIAAWLQRHPSITTIARDRGTEYIEGIRQGAPDAVQVADRWHLLKNLGDALEQFFLQQRSALQAAAQALAAQPLPAPIQERPLPTLEGGATPARERAARDQWHDHAATRYYTIHGMAAQHVSVAAIARTLAISRPTVYRYLRMPEPPQRAQIQRLRRSVLDSAKPYLVRRWNAGCRNARQLWQELHDQGLHVSLRTINRFVAVLRQDSAVRVGSFKTGSPAHRYTSTTTQRRPLTALQAMRLLMTDPAERKSWQQEYLRYLEIQTPCVTEVAQLVQDFLIMLRTRDGANLDLWLGRAQASTIAPLQTFARGLLKDYAAVKAGLTVEWSNGQTEAQIQRLKLLKRQMYGQASFPLLRKRVLYRDTAPREQPAPTTPMAC
jgi:transposase